MRVPEPEDVLGERVAVSGVRECRSPGRSESAWCLRWSVTHWVSGPCIAIEPRIAQTARSGALVSKLLWVKSRWKPMVIPSPQAT